LKKVLVVAYLFPPLGGVGVQRTLKFVKYLPQFGWQPVVLTVRRGSYEINDPTLLKEIPEQASIIRTSSFEPAGIYRKMSKFLKRSGAEHGNASAGISVAARINSTLFFPDDRIGWLPFAVQAGKKAVREADLIYSTAPPYTNHLAALRLKNLSGKPWVADFRDGWTTNPGVHFASALHRKLAVKWEKKILHSADSVITVSDQLSEELSQLGGEKECRTITNGYDEQDFAGISAEIPEQFTIVYSGSFYGQRTGRYFLEALSELLRSGDLPENVKVIISGKSDRTNQAILNASIRRYGLEKIIVQKGFLPYSENLKLILGASVLLLVLHQGPEARSAMTNKIFEYLRTGRPVLALVPEGAAAELIRTTKAGLTAEPEDTEKIKENIKEMYGQYTSGKLSGASPETIKQFERKALTSRLAEIFNALSGAGK